MNCPYCDNPLPPLTTQCPHCGAAVASTQESAQKLELYNPSAAALWSLLLTPIFGAYVIKSNWKTLGLEQQEKRSKTWLIALVIIELGIVLSPLDVNPAWLVSVAILCIWNFIECVPQKKYLDDNKIDYQKKGWTALVLKAIGIWIGAAILLSVLFFIGVLSGD